MTESKITFCKIICRGFRVNLSDYFLDLVRTMNEKSLIAIMRYLIYRIVANLAVAQMIQDFKFFVQIQFIIKQHHQLLKTASVHNRISDLYGTKKQFVTVKCYSISVLLPKQSARILISVCVLMAKPCYVLVRIDIWPGNSDKNLIGRVMGNWPLASRQPMPLGRRRFMKQLE